MASSTTPELRAFTERCVRSWVDLDLAQRHFRVAEVAEWAAVEGLTSVQDIRHYFSSEAAAAQASEGVRLAWLTAQREPAVDPTALAATRRLGGTAAAASRRGATVARLRVRICRLRPPKSNQIPSEAKDEAARRAAATRLARASLAWGPQAGIAKGAATPLPAARSNRLVAITVKRLSRHEARVLDNAARAWAKWCSWLQRNNIEEVCEQVLSDAGLPEEFVEDVGSDAPTSKLALWNSLAFMAKHVAAPVVIEPARKPRRTTSAAARPPGQATVAETHILLVLQAVFQSMLAASDWRTGVVAAGLCMAYACVRYKHIQRSRPWTRAAHGCRFQAFRDRKGDRTAFLWYLPWSTAARPWDPAELFWEHWHNWDGDRKYPTSQ